MGLKQIDHGSEEYKQVVQLRFSILREPLGLCFTEEDLASEKDHIHIAAYEEDDLLACCMLIKIDKGTVQLRQMAVKKNLQRKGIGASLMSFAESLAKDKGFKRIIMHARQTAIGFYEKFGYKVKGNVFTEVNIPHVVMEKHL
jgi:predicted GNAT family N-acyltransferase